MQDNQKITWTGKAIEQFKKCKEALANIAFLSHPNPELPFPLCTDTRLDGRINFTTI